MLEGVRTRQIVRLPLVEAGFTAARESAAESSAPNRLSLQRWILTGNKSVWLRVMRAAYPMTLATDILEWRGPLHPGRG
ncbi:hypothetical protein RIEGSTA812A_PEG_519 [invertebrate metagenome]|uniref:Uncharacterized protein n=1 Tax=invertebrate metagenome TaxID=1711999 RepID=A0A484H527_9ZZZZ